MAGTLKDTVVERSSMGKMLDRVSNLIAPGVDEATDRKMMFQVSYFIDDVVALAMQATIPNTRRRRTFQKTAIAFATENATQLSKIVRIHGQPLTQLGAVNVEAPLQELAQLTIFETILVRAATSHA